MRCLFCDSPIDILTLDNLIYKQDQLCNNCRKLLKVDKKYVNIGPIKVETLYNYDSIFKDILLQYKECYDEALSKVFLYRLEDYLYFKYFGYSIVFVPSSEKKLKIRGFNHLQLIFNDVKLKKINIVKMRKESIQEGKNLVDRRKMVDNYICKDGHYKKILIVDDVLTTGSSILGVYKAIGSKADKIKAISLSRKENAFIYQEKCV